MQELIGQTIGRYHIIEPLGEGGMAVVYKADDTLLKREVAVKVIRTENIPPKALEHTLKRFSREGRILRKLDHPNIVKVFDYGEFDGQPFLVMEYVPCGTLKQLIKNRKSIPWKESVQLLIPILQALDYAHSKGVIHRDIKPSNILLSQSGQPLLTDFGVAKIIEEDNTQELTATSASVGTPEYMAPEQITSKSFDTRADLYSLGIIFYEMMTGRRPFEADTPMAVLIKHTSDPLPRPSLFIDDLPKDVELFLIKSLSKDPNQRYQSAAAMLDACNALLAGIPLATQPDQQKESDRASFLSSFKTKPYSRKNVITFIGLIAFIGLVSLAFLIFLPKRQSIPTPYPMFLPPSTPMVLPSPSPSPSIIVTSEPTPTKMPAISGEFTGSINCRIGPDEHLYGFNKVVESQEVTLIGKNEDGSWALFKTADGNDECWTMTRFLILTEDPKMLDTVAAPEVVGEIHYGVVRAYCDEFWNGYQCPTQPKCLELEYTGEGSTEIKNLSEALLRATKMWNKYFNYRVLNVFEYTIESKYGLRSEYECYASFDGNYYTVQTY